MAKQPEQQEPDDRVLIELRAETDAKLSCFKLPGAREKLRKAMTRDAKLHGRVKVGPGR